MTLKKVPNIQPTRKLISIVLMGEFRVPYMVSPNSNSRVFVNRIGQCLIYRHGEMPTVCLILEALCTESFRRKLGSVRQVPNALPKIPDATN